jgi:flagellar motor component MotA
MTRIVDSPIILEVWVMEHRVKSLEERVAVLERSDVDKATRLAVAENNIKGMQADISAIKDDTKWLRRTITNVLISAPIIAIIGGVIGLVFWVIKGGV